VFRQETPDLYRFIAIGCCPSVDGASMPNAKITHSSPRWSHENSQKCVLQPKITNGVRA
jgi:hypothetical protein